MRQGELALLDKEEVVLVIDVQRAATVYEGSYDEDDEGRHIWIGGDDVIPCNDILGQVLYNGGLQWIAIERLSNIVE